MSSKAACVRALKKLGGNLEHDDQPGWYTRLVAPTGCHWDDDGVHAHCVYWNATPSQKPAYWDLALLEISGLGDAEPCDKSTCNSWFDDVGCEVWADSLQLTRPASYWSKLNLYGMAHWLSLGKLLIKKGNMSKMQTLSMNKKIESETIERQVEEFLSGGGVINYLRTGIIKPVESLSQNEFHSKLKAASDERKAAYGRRYQAKMEKNK